MSPFLHAAGRGPDAFDQIIEQLAAAPSDHNLGFLYVSEMLANALPANFDRLCAALPAISWVGGVGSALCSNAEAIYDQPAVVALVGPFGHDSFRLIGPLDSSLVDLDSETGQWWEAQESAFGLLHADPENPLLPGLLERLADGAAASFINGAFTSSSQANWQFCGQTLVNGALSGVVFNPLTPVLTDHTQGCSPMGPIHEVSEADGQLLLRLDGREALGVLNQELGRETSTPQRLAGELFVGVAVAGSDTGDYLVRNLLGYDPDRGLLLVGDTLENGQQLMFCRRDTDTARRDLELMCARIAARLKGRPIRGGIYIDCLGRGRSQFASPNEELTTLREKLGEFPLIGLFANGEIYNGRLYGYTGVLTLFV